MNLDVETDVKFTSQSDNSPASQFDRFEKTLSQCLRQISELHEANNKLMSEIQKAKADAFAAIDAKNRFLAGMSNEINKHLHENFNDKDTEGKKNFMNDKPLNGIKVLVAEDSPDNQMLMRQYLKLAGAEVDMADNGQEAVEKALSDNHHVIIMDVMMPICDGYEATRALREKGYKKPIIALTAHALKEQRERSFKEGCNEHLVKPINRPLLISTIAKFANQQV